MPLEKIHSFLVHPAKGQGDQPKIGGTLVPKTGQLYQMLARIFDRAPSECEIDIVFRPNDVGEQQNDARDALVRYVAKPTLANGRAVAQGLQAVTTHRSGLGLFFLMTGPSGNETRLVVSRFPADQGILAEEDQEQLSVEFVERVFMKSANAYKSAVYQSDSVGGGFWDGRAIDRQITGPKELSDYWIREFLSSELRTTGPAGTKRIAVALRRAIKNSEALTVRQELVATANLLRGYDGQTLSGRTLLDRLALSPQASEALERELPRPELMDEVFQFDRIEFEQHVMYRLVEMDNGALLMAEDNEFADVFEQTLIDESDRRVRFTTEGRVVDELLRKTK